MPVPPQGCLSPSLCEGILCLALPKAQEESPGHLWVVAEASPSRTLPHGPQLCAGLSSQAERAHGEITASLVSIDLPPGIPQTYSKPPSPADSHSKPCLHPPLPQDELSPEGDPQPVLAVGTSRHPRHSESWDPHALLAIGSTHDRKVSQRVTCVFFC